MTAYRWFRPPGTRWSAVAGSQVGLGRPRGFDSASERELVAGADASLAAAKRLRDARPVESTTSPDTGRSTPIATSGRTRPTPPLPVWSGVSLVRSTPDWGGPKPSASWPRSSGSPQVLARCRRRSGQALTCPAGARARRASIARTGRRKVSVVDAWPCSTRRWPGLVGRPRWARSCDGGRCWLPPDRCRQRLGARCQ